MKVCHSSIKKYDISNLRELFKKVGHPMKMAAILIVLIRVNFKPDKFFKSLKMDR